MKKAFIYIPVVLAALFMCLACSSDQTKVIPRSKMAKIYAEMFVVDQLTNSEPKYRQAADTSLVYEPILNKYGYDTDDYRKSVEFYMNDPERFARILRTTTEILDARIAELKELQSFEKRQEEVRRFITDFEIADYYPCLSREPYVHYYDSISVEYDTLKMYRMVSIERADTIYDCLRMILPSDTLDVAELDPMDEVLIHDSASRKKEENKVFRAAKFVHDSDFETVKK